MRMRVLHVANLFSQEIDALHRISFFEIPTHPGLAPVPPESTLAQTPSFATPTTVSLRPLSVITNERSKLADRTSLCRNQRVSSFRLRALGSCTKTKSLNDQLSYANSEFRSESKKDDGRSRNPLDFWLLRTIPSHTSTKKERRTQGPIGSRHLIPTIIVTRIDSGVMWLCRRGTMTNPL